MRHFSPGKELMGSNLKHTPSLGSLRVVMPTLGKKWYRSLAICREQKNRAIDIIIADLHLENSPEQKKMRGRGGEQTHLHLQ